MCFKKNYWVRDGVGAKGDWEGKWMAIEMTEELIRDVESEGPISLMKDF